MVLGTMWIVSAFIPEALQGGYALITAFLEDDFAAFNVRVAESRTQKLYRDYLQGLSVHAIRQQSLMKFHSGTQRGSFSKCSIFGQPKNHILNWKGPAIFFKRYHEPDRKPYVYDLMPEIEHPERHFSEFEIEKLLEGMDLSWLRFGKEDLSPLHEKIKALDSPLLVVPREVQIERGVDVLHDAAESLCTGAKRFLYERFFEEQAMAFKLFGRRRQGALGMDNCPQSSGPSLCGKKSRCVATAKIFDQFPLERRFYLCPED